MTMIDTTIDTTTDTAIAKATTIEADQLRAVLIALKPWKARGGFETQTRNNAVGVHVQTSDIGLRFTCTDRKQWLSLDVPSANIGDTFAGVIDIDDVKRILGKYKGAVSFSASDGDVHMVRGSRSTKLRDQDATMFPAPVFDNEPRTISGVKWSAIVDTAQSASTDDSRPILTGVLFTPDGEIVATDSYRLYVTRDAFHAWGEYETNDQNNVLVSASRLDRLHKLADLATDLEVVGSHARVLGTVRKFPEIRVSAVLDVIGGCFPHYRSLIPHDRDLVQCFEVTDEMVISAAEMVPLLSRSCVPLRINGRDNGVEFEATVQDSFSVTDALPTVTTIETDNDPAVKFNAEYFSDALASGATWFGVDAFKPWIQRDTFEGCDRIRLLMPVR